MMREPVSSYGFPSLSILPYDYQLHRRVLILVVIVDSPIVSLDEASVDLAPRLAVFFS
jgi:hypothetical protein